MNESAHADNVLDLMGAGGDLLSSNNVEASVPDMEHATTQVNYEARNIHLSCIPGLFYFSN